MSENKKLQTIFSVEFPESDIGDGDWMVESINTILYKMKKDSPLVWMRLQLAVMSVVNVKYGVHKSSMYTSPNVSTRVSLNPLPVNIDVIG